MDLTVDNLILLEVLVYQNSMLIKRLKVIGDVIYKRVSDLDHPNSCTECLLGTEHSLLCSVDCPAIDTYNFSYVVKKIRYSRLSY